MRTGAWLGIALLAACQPSDPPAPPPADDAALSPSTSGAPVATFDESVTSLGGEWKVAGIDGQELDQSVGLALSADAEEIWWAPRCAGLVRSYRLDGIAIHIGPAKEFAPSRAGEPSPPVCAIGLPPRLGEVARAIDSATSVRRTANNGVELSGGGHSLLLFRQ